MGRLTVQFDPYDPPPASGHVFECDLVFFIAAIPSSLSLVGQTAAPYSVGAGAPIAVQFTDPLPSTADWVAVYKAGQCSKTCPTGPLVWLYTCGKHAACATGMKSGTLVLNNAAINNGITTNWPLAAGSYQLAMLQKDGYSVMAGPYAFTGL